VDTGAIDAVVGEAEVDAVDGVRAVVVFVAVVVSVAIVGVVVAAVADEVGPRGGSDGAAASRAGEEHPTATVMSTLAVTSLHVVIAIAVPTSLLASRGASTGPPLADHHVAFAAVVAAAHPSRQIHHVRLATHRYGAAS
jgi:hypothetical protein